MSRRDRRSIATAGINDAHHLQSPPRLLDAPRFSSQDLALAGFGTIVPEAIRGVLRERGGDTLTRVDYLARMGEHFLRQALLPTRHACIKCAMAAPRSAVRYLFDCRRSESVATVLRVTPPA